MVKKYMNHFLKILSGVRKKFVEPKVYSLTLNNGIGGSLLHTVVAYSFEEAYEDGVKTAQKEHPQLFGPGHSVTLGMWTTRTIDELFASVMDVKIEPGKEGEPTSKNSLMQKIIETNDAVLLQENRSVFSDPEYQFLLEKIKVK